MTLKSGKAKQPQLYRLGEAFQSANLTKGKPKNKFNLKKYKHPQNITSQYAVMFDNLGFKDFVHPRACGFHLYLSKLIFLSFFFSKKKSSFQKICPYINSAYRQLPTTPNSSIYQPSSSSYYISTLFNSKIHGMATIARVSLLVLIIFSTSFMMLESRSLHGHPLIHKNADSYRLFHKLGFDHYVSKHIHYHVRDDDGAPNPRDRLSPGGPNPHHNTEPPSNKQLSLELVAVIHKQNFPQCCELARFTFDLQYLFFPLDLSFVVLYIYICLQNPVLEDMQVECGSLLFLLCCLRYFLLFDLQFYFQPVLEKSSEEAMCEHFVL